MSRYFGIVQIHCFSLPHCCKHPATDLPSVSITKVAVLVFVPIISSIFLNGNNNYFCLIYLVGVHGYLCFVFC